MSCKLTAKQHKKYVYGDKICYEFLIFKDGDPFYMHQRTSPKLNNDGKIIIDPETKRVVTEIINVPAKVTLAVDPEAPRNKIEAEVKRQLLEIQLRMDCKDINIKDSHDFDEIRLD